MRAALIAAPCILLSLVAAEARQCYRRVVEPASYASVPERVLVSPERQVSETIPAVTRQVEETVVVQPARRIAHILPARYGVQYAAVLVSPARKEWRTRDENGEIIGCWVTVPTVYAREGRRVRLAPAREEIETVPEQTATRLRTEVVEPERTLTRTIPAQYATRTHVVQTAPASARWAPIAQNCPD